MLVSVTVIVVATSTTKVKMTTWTLTRMKDLDHNHVKENRANSSDDHWNSFDLMRVDNSVSCFNHEPKCGYNQESHTK